MLVAVVWFLSLGVVCVCVVVLFSVAVFGFQSLACLSKTGYGAGT